MQNIVDVWKVSSRSFEKRQCISRSKFDNKKKKKKKKNNNNNNNNNNND